MPAARESCSFDDDAARSRAGAGDARWRRRGYASCLARSIFGALVCVLLCYTHRDSVRHGRAVVEGGFCLCCLCYLHLRDYRERDQRSESWTNSILLPMLALPLLAFSRHFSLGLLRSRTTLWNASAPILIKHVSLRFRCSRSLRFSRCFIATPPRSAHSRAGLHRDRCRRRERGLRNTAPDDTTTDRFSFCHY